MGRATDVSLSLIGEWQARALLRTSVGSTDELQWRRIHGTLCIKSRRVARIGLFRGCSSTSGASNTRRTGRQFDVRLDENNFDG